MSLRLRLFVPFGNGAEREHKQPNQFSQATPSKSHRCSSSNKTRHRYQKNPRAIYPLASTPDDTAQDTAQRDVAFGGSSSLSRLNVRCFAFLSNETIPPAPQLVFDDADPVLTSDWIGVGNTSWDPSGPAAKGAFRYFTVETVPEPSCACLTLSGLLGFLMLRPNRA